MTKLLVNRGCLKGRRTRIKLALDPSRSTGRWLAVSRQRPVCSISAIYFKGSLSAGSPLIRRSKAVLSKGINCIPEVQMISDANKQKVEV